MPRTTLPRRATLPALAGLLLLGAGCARSQGDAPPEQAATPAAGARVPFVQPQRRALERVVEQPGTVRAYEETPIFAKLAGYVTRVNADIGDEVKGPRYDKSGELVEPGQVLAVIAMPELEQEAQQKEALVAQARAEQEQAKKALAVAGANVAAAAAALREAEAGVARAEANCRRWESELRRVGGLVKGGIIDEQTRDEMTNQLESATAACEEARARISSARAMQSKYQAEEAKARADVDAAAARLKVAEAEARRLRALLDYTTVRAPFDGIVTRRGVDTGHLLRPGAEDPANALFTVARIDPVRVAVDVPEADAPLVKPGDPVKVVVQALGGEGFPGKVTRTAWGLAPGSRTLRAEADLPNPDRRLRPGMYVYAHITVKLPEGWVLPAAAVMRRGDEVIGYRLEGGKVWRTELRVGHGDPEYVQVFGWRKADSSGPWRELTGEERFAAGKLADLTDGQAVEARE